MLLLLVLVLVLLLGGDVLVLLLLLLLLLLLCTHYTPSPSIWPIFITVFIAPEPPLIRMGPQKRALVRAPQVSRREGGSVWVEAEDVVVVFGEGHVFSLCFLSSFLPCFPPFLLSPLSLFLFLLLLLSLSLSLLPILQFPQSGFGEADRN